MMKIWIIVGDERESLFYDAGGADAPFRLVLKVTNAQARPDREPETDRPDGELETPDRASSSSAGQRHGSDGEHSAPRSDQEDFAKRIADEIDRARHAGSFDRFVLGAGPRMLGLIRVVLSAPSRAVLAAEVAKDLVTFDERALVEHLRPEVLPQSVQRQGRLH